MPLIKAFHAIHPNSSNAEAVVSAIEEMSLETARQIRDKNPYSFIHLLVPEIKTDLKGTKKKQLVFNKINENLKFFLNNKILLRDEDPAIYIYRNTNSEGTFTGIWTCTSIDDYANGKIKKHEHIKPEREEQLSQYLEHTGIDANPVLITYPGSKKVNELIYEATKIEPVIRFKLGNETIALWKIDMPDLINQITNAFSAIDVAYIADGHHRAAAALHYGIKRRSTLTTYSPNDEFNYFSTVYIAKDQLKTYSFNRMIKGLNGLSAEEFLNKLRTCFEIYESLGMPNYIAANESGLYLQNKWYKLIMPDLLQNRKQFTCLPASFLQDHILGPILGITDQENNQRLGFISGKHSINELEAKVNSAEFDMAFVLKAVTIDQIIRVADSGEIMPAKSTYFEPKFPVGLITHLIHSNAQDSF